MLGNEEYEKYHCNLLATGMGGLEHHNGVYIAEQYATSYTCKGGESSANWEATSAAITDEYCNRECNEARTLHSLMGKHMNEITNGMSITRDQSQYILGGGKMKRSSIGTPLKCSLKFHGFRRFC